MIIGLFKYRIDVFLNQQKYNPAELIFIEGVFLHQYVSIIHQIEGLKIHHNGLKILLVIKKGPSHWVGYSGVHYLFSFCIK